ADQLAEVHARDARALYHRGDQAEVRVHDLVADRIGQTAPADDGPRGAEGQALVAKASQELHGPITEVIEAHEQLALFLERKGARLAAGLADDLRDPPVAGPRGEDHSVEVGRLGALGAEG